MSAGRVDFIHQRAAVGVGAGVATRILDCPAEDVRKEFNTSGDKVRILALLSLTCPGCQPGYAVVGRRLERFSSPQLQAILIWEPMRTEDSPAAAMQRVAAVHDPLIW
jgi:hypothetical protein